MLAILLLISAFFSISETSLMALSRLRLRHLAREGHRSARRVQYLLEQTDRLLGTILLGNNLVNAAATALVTAMAIRFVGDNEWALLVATGAITFLILVFAEITPKIIGATYPERIALPASYPLQTPAAAVSAGRLVRQPVRQVDVVAAARAVHATSEASHD